MRTPLSLHKETLRVLTSEESVAVGAGHHRHNGSVPTVDDATCACVTSVDLACYHYTNLSRRCATLPGNG